MEQVLIDYNEDPVFYVCKDNEKYFLVLCTDIENMKYYVSEVGIHTLAELVNGEKPMRDAFLMGSSFWMVAASDNPENDLVNPFIVEEIDLADMP
jgi:indole-3-glycerol phosphate synthase